MCSLALACALAPLACAAAEAADDPSPSAEDDRLQRPSPWIPLVRAAPRARVQLRALPGNYVPLDLLRRLRDDARRCYVEQLRRSPERAGTVEIRFTSARTNRVESLQLTPTSPEAAPLVPCAELLLRRGFPSSCKGGPKTPAAVALEFRVERPPA